MLGVVLALEALKTWVAGTSPAHKRASWQARVLFRRGPGIIFFTAFLFKHADPMGDGMEMVVTSIAFIFIFLPFSLPAYLLAKVGRFLISAALLVLIGSFPLFRAVAQISRRAQHSAGAVERGLAACTFPIPRHACSSRSPGPSAPISSCRGSGRFITAITRSSLSLSAARRPATGTLAIRSTLRS